MTRVAILGAGPAGVGAAWRLRAEGKADVLLLERGARVGGNAGSFDWNGHRLDFGSHRLHPACEPGILDDIRGFLGEDLLDRPRHGRIRLLGRWVHFPLKPLDLLLHLHPRFAAGAARDAVTRMLPRRRRPQEEEDFATVLEEKLGRTICRDFYFPYAVKLWGLDPHELSAVQARRRVSAGSFRKLLRKVLAQVPGLGPPGAGRFFYPRGGYGQISAAYARAAEELGADLRLGHAVTSVERREGGFLVAGEGDRGTWSEEVDHVWSTIPITALVRMLRPAPPEDVLEAASGIRYRAMLLVYVELPVDRFTEFDAHYFPGPDVRITRLSETKNYAARSDPPGRTVVCAELPCEAGDATWALDDGALGDLLVADLSRSGLAVPEKRLDVRVERLPQAYPVYVAGYERAFDAMDGWVGSEEGLLTYGRQGLFAHDNTHHALYMAYAAASCLGEDGGFDRRRWELHREEFKGHVVED